VVLISAATLDRISPGVPALNKMYEQYKDRVAFFVVYIQEAHAATCGRCPATSGRASYSGCRGVSRSERASRPAASGAGHQDSALIDDMSDSTERAYTGWPDRIYLIDRSGRVTFKTKPGPFGFDPSLLKTQLERVTRRRKLSKARRSGCGIY